MALPTTPRTPYQQLSLGVEASWFGAAFQQGVLADFILLKDEWRNVPGHSG